MERKKPPEDIKPLVTDASNEESHIIEGKGQVDALKDTEETATKSEKVIQYGFCTK